MSEAGRSGFKSSVGAWKIIQDAQRAAENITGQQELSRIAVALESIERSLKSLAMKHGAELT